MVENKKLGDTKNNSREILEKIIKNYKYEIVKSEMLHLTENAYNFKVISL